MANAFDSDSPSVEINFDFEAMPKARDAVLASAKAALKKGKSDRAAKARIGNGPLPDEIKVVISDRGVE